MLYAKRPQTGAAQSPEYPDGLLASERAGSTDDSYLPSAAPRTPELLEWYSLPFPNLDSVPQDLGIDLETPGVDTPLEILHLVEAELLQQVDGPCRPWPVVAVGNDEVSWIEL